MVHPGAGMSWWLCWALRTVCPLLFVTRRKLVVYCCDRWHYFRTWIIISVKKCATAIVYLLAQHGKLWVKLQNSSWLQQGSSPAGQDNFSFSDRKDNKLEVVWNVWNAHTAVCLLRGNRYGHISLKGLLFQSAATFLSHWQLQTSVGPVFSMQLLGEVRMCLFHGEHSSLTCRGWPASLAWSCRVTEPCRDAAPHGYKWMLNRAGVWAASHGLQPWWSTDLLDHHAAGLPSCHLTHFWAPSGSQGLESWGNSSSARDALLTQPPTVQTKMCEARQGASTSPPTAGMRWQRCTPLHTAGLEHIAFFLPLLLIGPSKKKNKGRKGGKVHGCALGRLCGSQARRLFFAGLQCTGSAKVRFVPCVQSCKDTRRGLLGWESWAADVSSGRREKVRFFLPGAQRACCCLGVSYSMCSMVGGEVCSLLGSAGEQH